ESCANRFQARVIDRIYLGNRYRLALAADALPGQTLLADVSGESHERLADLPTQEDLWVALPRQALQVFA
ncbi:TOBE domain-containing protein, partial [Acinetobacter baumannii]